MVSGAHQRLLTLAALTGLAATLGLWQRQRGWLLTAAVMLLVLLHAWPLWWVTLPQLGLLLPWYALQLVILAWILVWHEGSLQEYLGRQLPSRVITHQDMRQELARLVFKVLAMVDRSGDCRMDAA